MFDRNETDETLVMLTLAGEQTAFETLVVRYQRAVVAAALSVTRNEFMAEDAAQDAFVTAWMKLDTLQEPQKFGSWVCRIAKNCALNMMGRYRAYLPLDVVDNLAILDDPTQNPAELYALSEEHNEVNKSVEKLPERVRQIIYLHYFEGLSIAEIADRMRISEGTVKWQLHDGRKRIRKELCAMNEKYTDTLVQRVMKKVEELKLWQVRNNKSGFEAVYRDVLREVEELPESKIRSHALADVLMRGWWWLPGKKNDELFARIRTAAIEGKNEEVMTFIVTREDSKVYGGAKIDFIRDKQIPMLEKAGFVQTLAREWFWLGYRLLKEGKTEEGRAAYDKVEEILARGDAYFALVPYARKMEEILADYAEKPKNRYQIGGSAEEYRMIDGSLRYWTNVGFGEGYLGSVDGEITHIFRNSSACDGYFFADIAVGESFVGSDGTTLTFASDNETVDTPAGRFEGCQLWITRKWGDWGKSVAKSYYKDSVGIVRHEHTIDGATDVRVLKAYNVKGGKGLLPFSVGNTWEYAAEYDPEAMISELTFAVEFADEERVLLSTFGRLERLKYDENAWLDMVQQIANDYVDEKKNGNSFICDVTPAIERAEALAKTPMERAHTKAAASVARRIMATDTTFNPEYTATGHWNFFTRNIVQKKQDSLCISAYNHRWSFEWKMTGSMGAAETPILYNDILGILQDATNRIWSDEWRVGASPIVEYTRYSRDVRTQIICEDGGTVTTKAGTFPDCLKLCLDIGGMTDGWSYRGGKKVYYFAKGVGIVRTESLYCGGARTAVYELTSYEGTGEGYMPMADGLVRRYDALNLTDGFVGSVEYAYVADEDGDIVIFGDRTGIRELTSPVTQYGAIQGERIEQDLMDAGNWKGAQQQNGVNNFHLILHMLARPSHNRYNSKRSIETNGFNLKMMELLGDGTVPPAWYGVYAWTALVRGAACFGHGMGFSVPEEVEEGYRMLDLALEYYEKMAKIPDGEELETGNAWLLGGAKYLKGKELLLLQSGNKEPISYEYRMDSNAQTMLYALTAPHGWEWFNKVRHEERFKEYIEKARKLAGKG